MRFFGRYLNEITLGPLKCSTTVAETKMSLTAGVPIMNVSPSPMNRTRDRSNFLPTSWARRSTSMVEPSTARYCLPPLSTIANLILFSPVIHFAARPAEVLHSAPDCGEAGFFTAIAPVSSSGAEADDIIHAGQRYCQQANCRRNGATRPKVPL